MSLCSRVAVRADRKRIGKILNSSIRLRFTLLDLYGVREQRDFVQWRSSAAGGQDGERLLLKADAYGYDDGADASLRRQRPAY